MLMLQQLVAAADVAMLHRAAIARRFQVQATFVVNNISLWLQREQLPIAIASGYEWNGFDSVRVWVWVHESWTESESATKWVHSARRMGKEKNFHNYKQGNGEARRTPCHQLGVARRKCAKSGWLASVADYLIEMIMFWRCPLNVIMQQSATATAAATSLPSLQAPCRFLLRSLIVYN